MHCLFASAIDHAPKAKIIWRIDLIGIELTQKGKLKNITHFKNILNG